jgi:deazaflavin-dependent oxidoreductase (nitroreductase family)
MDDTTRAALRHGHRIDITTTGRVTGAPRRIEITFLNLGGRIYISGLPRPDRQRAWLRNLHANPEFTFHLKGPVATADLPATARIVTDADERAGILAHFAAAWHRSDLPVMIDHSPLIEVTIEGLEPEPATAGTASDASAS